MTDDKLAIVGGHPVRSRPWPKWPQATPGTVEVVTDVLTSSRWALSGAHDGRECYERRFAQAFAAFHDVPYCTPTTSGTTALMLALQALGIGRGDEVLVPGLTWVACASSVARLGAVPVLVDCDPVSLAMDPALARAAITGKTAAIMVVHPFCSLADLDAFVTLGADRGIALIEDCSQAHGAAWRGRKVGTLGTVGCFSMQQSKLLTAGEGGAVITARADLYDRLEQLRCDGRRFAASPEPGWLELVEVATVQGQNHCLSELQAAVLLDGLGRLAAANEARAQQAEYLESVLAGIEGVRPLPRDDRVTSRTFYNFVLRFDLEAFAGNTVDVIARALSAELGTMVNPVYVPLSRHRLLCPDKIPAGDTPPSEIARLDPSRYALPAAERARRTCATLTHPVFLDDKRGMDDIAGAISKVQRFAQHLHQLPQEASARAF